MKKLFLMTAVGALLLTSSVFAQDADQPTPEDRAKTLTTKLASELSLDDGQSEKIHTMILNAAKAVDKLKRAHDGNNTEELKKKREEIIERREQAVVGVLNEEQKAKYKELKGSMKKQQTTQQKPQKEKDEVDRDAEEQDK